MAVLPRSPARDVWGDRATLRSHRKRSSVVKRFAVFVLVVSLILGAAEAYRMHRNDIEDADHGRENRLLKVVTRVRSGRVESIGIGTKAVEIDGKKTTIEFPDADASEVSVRLAPAVRFEGDHLDGTFWVTIPAREPSLLTNPKYEKITTGMTYSQVGETLGGVMAKGRMTDGFWSRVELVEGKRRIYLTFADGKVTEKSARDLK
jgi:hypothetical protein